MEEKLTNLNLSQLQTMAKDFGLDNHLNKNKKELVKSLNNVNKTLLNKYLNKKQLKDLNTIINMDNIFKRFFNWLWPTSQTTQSTESEKLVKKEKEEKKKKKDSDDESSSSNLSKDDFIEEKTHTTSKVEELTRKILEKKYPGYKFPPVKCKKIRFPESNRKISIDCFNYDLKICVEYQGVQHYEYTPYFHGDDIGKFHQQVKRDKFKKSSLEKHFTYVAIPHTCKNETQIKSYLDSKLPTKKDDNKNKKSSEGSSCNIM